MIMVLIPIAVQPRFDEDKIGNERRDLAFKDSRVPANDVFILGTGLVELIDHWKKPKV